MTGTLKEKLAELRKALSDWLDLNNINQGLCSEISKIRSELEAKKGHVERLQQEFDQLEFTVHELGLK